MPPIDAVRELSSCAMSLIGAFVNSHDVANVSSLPALLEPLRALSPNVAIVADLCVLAHDRVVGRELGQRMGLVAERLMLMNEIPAMLRVGGGAITKHFQAVEHARRGSNRALEVIDSLVPIVDEEAFFVQHGRWLALAFRGESAAAKPFRKQVEAISEDDVWRRRALLFVEAQLHALTGDASSLERTRDAIAELAERFSGWRPWLHWTNAALRRLHGELSAADDELRAALALAAAGEHRAWVLAAPAHAELLLLQADPSGAVRAADAIVQAVDALSLDRSAAVSAERVRALALSQLGDHAQATASLERAFVVAGELEYGGLPLAQLYEAQSRVALAAGASEASVAALTSLWRLIEHADAPALWNAYEALRGESGGQLGVADLPPVGGDTSTPLSTATYTQVRTRFGALNERRERTRHALSLLLEECQAASGHLLLLDAGRLFAAASIGLAAASDQLVAEAQRLLTLEASPTETMALTTTASDAVAHSPSAHWLSDGESSFAPVLLVDGAEGHALLSGVVLLTVRGEVQKQPRSELVHAISRCLRAAGDCVAVAVED
jgi:tetratricopeptide (TPR) repeat protein